MKDQKLKPGKLEKELAKKKKEIARKEKEEAKKTLEAEKRESSFERASDSMEKLQLNWIKWNLTCIALGFTAYKVYQSQLDEGKNLAKYYVTGRELGVFLIILGFTSLLIATIRHKNKYEKLRSQSPSIRYSLSQWISYIILCFTLIVFLMVLYRG
jgi:uncharacterized membrane protein YidH (DUF202 family)